MNTSSLFIAALLSSVSLFACAGGGAAARDAATPCDDAAWHPADATELSFGASSTTTAGTGTRHESVDPIALRPNAHEAPRGSLYAVAGTKSSIEARRTP
jgi:hypothetical protein